MLKIKVHENRSERTSFVETMSMGTIKYKSNRRETAEAFIIAIIMALLIRTFFIQAFKIPSGSMQPTLLPGDHILVNKFSYGFKIPFTRTTLIPIGDPKRNDVIVFIYPKDEHKDFIKRVIGLPGDTVQMTNRKISINGEPFDDKYGFFTDQRSKPPFLPKKVNYGPITVPENHLFVMGDNRDNSHDSRYWGYVPLDSVKGKALIIYWSWPHWKRFLNIVH